MSLVVNLVGGPGTGKSSIMAGVFAELKFRGHTVEMAPEWVKGKVWEGNLEVLENQSYIFGKQVNTIHRLHGKVEAIITDSPIILSRVYGKKESPEFADLVVEVFNRYRNLNIFLKRIKPYDPKGRVQTEEKARELDTEFKEMLEELHIPFFEFDAAPESVKAIADLVEHRL